MILNASVRTLSLLIAVVTRASGSYLRERRTALFQYHGKDASSAVAANGKIADANGLELSIAAIPSEQLEDPFHEEVSEIAEAPVMEENKGPSRSRITSYRGEYEYDEPVSIDFFLDPSEGDLSHHTMGIFMLSTGPEGGSIDPVVALPLCPDGGCADAGSGTAAGTVMFSLETAWQMKPEPQWPIDLRQWGTQFVAYVLDGIGETVVGPVAFNIMMNDAY